MKSIFESIESKSLSADFEVVGNDIHSQASKKYLKVLNARCKELKLDYNQCRDAARLFKKGDFQGALKKIWGKSKVKVTSMHSNDGNVETYIYEVVGYATFTEKFIRKGLSMWSHTITAKYVDNPDPSFPLATVISTECKSLNDRDHEICTRDAFAHRSTAAIYNILFVCMDGYDMSISLSKYHLKLKNRL